MVQISLKPVHRASGLRRPASRDTTNPRKQAHCLDNGHRETPPTLGLRHETKAVVLGVWYCALATFSEAQDASAFSVYCVHSVVQHLGLRLRPAARIKLAGFSLVMGWVFFVLLCSFCQLTPRHQPPRTLGLGFGPESSPSPPVGFRHCICECVSPKWMDGSSVFAAFNALSTSSSSAVCVLLRLLGFTWVGVDVSCGPSIFSSCCSPGKGDALCVPISFLEY